MNAGNNPPPAGRRLTTYADWLAGREFYPERIIIEPTDACNLRCEQCPRQHRAPVPPGFMAWPDYERLVGELAGFPACKVCLFFRGEPFLHPRILEMIGLLKARTPHTLIIFTNGVRLDPPRLDRLVGLNLDFLSFSVDSIDRARYESIRANPHLERVLANVEYYRRHKRPEQVLQVSMVETALNREEKERFIRFWQGKADRVRIYADHTRDGQYGSLAGDGGARQPCLKPLNEVAINWRGDVTLCCYDWERSAPLGNVFTDTLRGVWTNDRYRAVREDHRLHGGAGDPVCRGCGHWRMYYTESKLIGELY